MYLFFVGYMKNTWYHKGKDMEETIYGYNNCFTVYR